MLSLSHSETQNCSFAPCLLGREQEMMMQPKLMLQSMLLEVCFPCTMVVSSTCHAMQLLVPESS